MAEALLSGDLRKTSPIKVLLHENEEIGLRFEQAKKGKKKVSVSSPEEKEEEDT